MKKKNSMVLAVILLVCCSLWAQPQSTDLTPYLMNQPVDVSADFRDLSNTMFFADKLASFDVQAGEGLVSWKRGHLRPRQAFNTCRLTTACKPLRLIAAHQNRNS